MTWSRRRGQKIADEDRYWSKVDRRGPNQCWPWVGGVDHCGYPIFWDGTYRPSGSPRSVRAARWAYERFIGPLGRLQVLHRCDNPPCMNPAHWFVGTPGDNARDRAAKGRSGATGARPGEANHQAKITAADVRVIRQRCAGGERQTDVAADYGLTQSHVSDIVRGKRWVTVV